MKSLPDVSTISRSLSQYLSRSFVIDGLHREQFRRITLDFDGSVLSTRGNAQGSAMRFNKSKKGARSYYLLFCTIAQTGQFLDMHHRPGNIHDSNGAADVMLKCFKHIKPHLPGAILESRMDGAFFNKDIVSLMASNQIKFTASVSFARFSELKPMIETCESWSYICKRLEANQVFTLASMMAHNFSREMQMVANPAVSRAKAKRPAAWTFQKLETIRR